MLKTIRSAKGFTLVELAIVLVIIGIILGAVLKGQELVNNAKTKRLYQQYREMYAAMYTYYDRYGLFPGDDTTAAARGGIWTGLTAGDGNGLIATGTTATAANYACAATGAEQCDMWRELRLAGIISGSTAAGAASFRNPSHSYGGAIAVSYSTVSALTTNFIQFQNVPAEVCQIIDTQYDDGVQTTGDIRGSAAYTAGTIIPTLAIRV
jgi:prepilin-type N-terminal cleavage/methylation domain-containing protein